MSATNTISPEKLVRLIGTPNCPVIIDVRPDGNELLPASIRRPAETCANGRGSLIGQKVVVACVHGQERSAGVAAILRSEGVDAETLEGGFAAWRDAGLPVIDAAKLPRAGPGGPHRLGHARPAQGRPDRLPWLIRRFVDPAAVFLFVAPAEVAGVAERFGATPFDVDGVFWSHRGEQCSFDTMVEELGPRRVRRACSGWRSSSAEPTRPARKSRRRPRACSPRRSACRGCIPTISNSSRPEC